MTLRDEIGKNRPERIDLRSREKGSERKELSLSTLSLSLSLNFDIHHFSTRQRAMANFNAPFEVNPYDLPTASANGGNLTSEDHDESLPQAFPSYGSTSLPVSSTVGRTEEASKKVRETKSLKGERENK